MTIGWNATRSAAIARIVQLRGKGFTDMMAGNHLHSRLAMIPLSSKLLFHRTRIRTHNSSSGGMRPVAETLGCFAQT